LVITYPRELLGELGAELGEAYVPEGACWGRYADEDTPKYLSGHLAQISRIQARAAAKLASRKWDLFIYVDTLVDRVSHPYWPYMRPDDYDAVDPAKAARYADVVREAYRETDLHLRQVLEAAPGPCWVVVVSDHGFRSSRDRKMQVGEHGLGGIYLVSGPDVRSARGTHSHLEDVTPTVLHLLGKPVSGEMKGRVIPEVATLTGHPIETVATYEDGVERGTNVPVDQETWDQLKGLGYVSGQ
jgi:predicted AlkP superfamily phosphohydrolase/phosphomutase